MTMKTKSMIAALALLMTGGTGAAQAGTCQDEMARYAKQVAEDEAADTSEWAAGAKENNDKINERMKANILKGCAPGGFYDQLDEAIREDIDRLITGIL